VARPIVRTVTQWDEYTGRLEAVERVDVKAQVSGFVESVSFTEGALVHKGDLLLTIDSRIFQAQLESAQAAVQEAKARLQLAQATLALGQSDLRRTEEAAKTGGVSFGELDTGRATVAQNEASVAEAQAAIAVAETAVKSASLNLEWTKVVAPITGRISSKGITPGNMLTGGPGQTTTISTITSVDPIYCYVETDEASVLKYQKLAREKKRATAVDGDVPCYMGLANEEGFPHAGVIDFVDNRMNPTTSTRRVRGVFPNPDGTLLPGFFARFRVVGQDFPNALMVIDDSVGTDQDRKYLFVMHPDKTIERRTVAVGPLIGELRVIESNLGPDDLVLVNGISSLMMVRPGGTVDPTTVPMPEHRFATAAPAPQSQPAKTPTEGGT
jgi:multidrug efflux system membrane fusion protein